MHRNPPKLLTKFNNFFDILLTDTQTNQQTNAGWHKPHWRR